MKNNKPDDIQRRYYSDTADKYDSWHVEPDGTNWDALPIIHALVDAYNGSSILDIGCGTGHKTDFFFRHGKNVYGLEPVRKMLDQAVEKSPGLSKRLVQGSGLSLPFGDKAFDVVCEFGSLHHVKQPNVVVTEMIRVARRAIFVSDSNRYGQGPQAARITKLLLYKFHLWGIADWIKTMGRGYTFSPGDGLSYSYSVYDSYSLLANWADRIILIGTGKRKRLESWHHPLLTSEGVVLCAFKD